MTWNANVQSGVILHMNNKTLTVNEDVKVFGGVRFQNGNTVKIGGDLLVTPATASAYMYHSTWFLDGSIEINQNVTWSTGWVYLGGAFAGNATTGNTIKLNGNNLNYVRVNDVNGEWTCLDDFRVNGEFHMYKDNLRLQILVLSIKQI